MTGETVADGKGTLKAAYLCDGTDVISGKAGCLVEELSVECTSMFKYTDPLLECESCVVDRCWC